MWDYSEKVKEHFLNPRNVGEIKDADAVGEVGNITCGDALKLTLKLDENQRIVDAKFKTFGCASAIASSSALTEIIKGKTLDEALEIGNEQIAQFLEGLPEEKMHCSVMGRDALEAAVKNYRGEKLKEQEQQQEGTIVCRCFGVTDEKIKRVVRENHLTTVDEVTHYCKAGGGCGSCKEEIQRLINQVYGEEQVPKLTLQRTRLTNIQKIERIQKVIEEEIRPVLAKDNGDIELIDIMGNRVVVSMRGSCANCPVAPITLQSYVQEKLRELVSEDLVVEEVRS